MEPLIRYQDVTVRYGESPLLREVSFQVPERERAVLYGRSGSGKSTILTTLAGAHRPAEGAVWFRGRQVTPATLPLVRRSVAFIGQEPVLGAATVREALMLPFTYRANRRLAPGRRRLADTLEKLRLDPSILDSDASVISGGEKQRVVIARALLLGKQVFLADEVTSALDPESTEAVLELFGDHRFTLLSVSHDPDWFSICSQFIQVDEGRIVRISGSPPGAEESYA
jgi:putative ABC transport system ATP-binding protein